MKANENGQWDRIASDIENMVDEAYEQLRNLSGEAIRFRPAPDDWSVKEVVGHLVDSASNNHQRFVRLQMTDGLDFPDYRQDNAHWVRIQKYQEEEWDGLLALWRYCTLHLARMVRTVDQGCLDHIWVVDENTSMTLGDLMTDYPKHLKGHLEQIRKNLTQIL